MDLDSFWPITSVLAAAVSSLMAYLSWRLRRVINEDKKKEMYGWLSQFNPWNWIPQDVGVNDPRYWDFQAHVERLSTYRGLVDKDMRIDYARMCDLYHESKLNDKEAREAMALTKDLREKAKHRLF